VKSPPKQKLLFFLGSGVSRPTRLPDVIELTKELFQSSCDPRVTRLQKFLDFLRKAQSDYQAQRRGTEANYEVVDGFGPEGKSVRYLLSTTPNPKHAIRICKPHGSINWFRLADKSGVLRFASVDSSPWFCRDEADELLDPVGPPQFLAGSYNKMLEYGYGVFGYMQSWFHSLLEEYNLIVMSGYGWADKGINRSLGEWLLQNGSKRRIILLHKNPEKLRAESKHGFHWRFDDLVAQGRLVLHRHWLEKTDAKTVLKLASNSQRK